MISPLLRHDKEAKEIRSDKMAKHQDICSGEELTFICECCGEECGACYGAYDDYPELCDDCWAEIPKKEERDDV